MAAIDYFLKIEGITGEATDNKHKDEIDIESWSWGATNSGSHSYGGGGGVGKVQMQDLSFTMRVNKSSPKLFLACATGQHITGALLTCRKAGKQQQEYLKIKLTDLLISSYQSGGSGGGENIVPVDTATINFSKLEMTYTPQKPDGSLGTAIVQWYETKSQTSG